MRKFHLQAFSQFHFTSESRLVVKRFRDLQKTIQDPWIKSSRLPDQDFNGIPIRKSILIGAPGCKGIKDIHHCKNTKKLESTFLLPVPFPIE